MVSSSHEAMHRIFQLDPGIFARTFDTLGIPFPSPAGVSVLPTDVTELQPLERRLDTLLQIDTAQGHSYLLAVEAQGRKDREKHASWAYYTAYLYAKYRLPPILLVVCRDEGTARWAAAQHHIGPPRWRTLTFRPMVLGPHNVPVITDPAAAARDVPLAALSAITHSNHPDADSMLHALVTALKTVEDDTALLFSEFTELGLGTTRAGKIWRKLMTLDHSFFRSETSNKMRAVAHTKGLEEGLAGRAEDLLVMLRHRGVEMPQEAEERIAACRDADTLHTWFVRALTATRIEEVFTGE